jgi:hypothetical protein
LTVDLDIEVGNWDIEEIKSKSQVLVSDAQFQNASFRDGPRASGQRAWVTSSGWGMRWVRRISHHTPAISRMPHSRFHMP